MKQRQKRSALMAAVKAAKEADDAAKDVCGSCILVALLFDVCRSCEVLLTYKEMFDVVCLPIFTKIVADRRRESEEQRSGNEKRKTKCALLRRLSSLIQRSLQR